jgi:hypothetical protein|eukprot:30849-Pelagococcus_subviridis.AAC.2
MKGDGTRAIERDVVTERWRAGEKRSFRFVRTRGNRNRKITTHRIDARFAASQSDRSTNRPNPAPRKYSAT